MDPTLNESSTSPTKAHSDVSATRAASASPVPGEEEGKEGEGESIRRLPADAIGEPSTTTQPDRSPGDDHVEITDDPWSRLGGGCVNERPRRRRVEALETGATTTTVKHSLSPEHGHDDAHQNTNQDATTESQYDPLRHKAHLWHALEGLDRYPNYLSRWNDESDILRLERALEVQLDRVRQQRRHAHSYRRFLQNLIDNDEVLLALPSPIRSLLLKPPTSWQELRDRRILDPKIVEAVSSSRQFRQSHPPPPSLVALCSGSVPGGVELDVTRLAEIMDEEVPDVFALPVLTPEFGGHVCDWIEAVASRVQHRLASTASQRDPPVSTATSNDPDLDVWIAQSRRPLDLSDVGLDWLVNLLFNLVVQPISRHLFAKELGSGTGRSLDWKQAFVAGYSPKPSSSPSSAAAPRQHLVPHTDDSEVTLNVCLGRDFEGGVLEFGELRGQSSRHEPANSDRVYEPQSGRGVIHAGRHFHAVSPVTSGSRYSLILWARSWSGIRATTCPCCWLNRRTNADQGAAQPCICGPRWN
jgi:2OG-Fe(II) oxygenase superfamily